MSQQYQSLFNAHINKNSHSNLLSTIRSTHIITISLGIYYKNNNARYEGQRDLPYLFTKGINEIVNSNPNTFCLHNEHNTMIYIYSDCELENQETLTEICLWLTRLQTTLRTIRFCTGADRRKIQGIQNITKSIAISELMAYFRMFKGIHDIIDNQIILMDKRYNIISLMKELLNNIIEYNQFELYSEDIMEINQYVDKLINKYTYQIPIP